MAENLVELAGSDRPAPRNALRVKDVDPHAHIEVTVTLKAPPLPALTAMPPATLTRAQIDETWGVPAPTLQKVEDVLRTYGLDIRSVNQGGRSVRVAGTISALESAFQPKLALYRIPGVGEIRGRAGTLMVPRELDGLITGIHGFDQRQMAKRHSTALAAVPALGPALRPLKPADLRARYNFPKGNGAGSVIAVAEFGVPLQNEPSLFPAYIAADVRDFCIAQDVPVPDIRVESVNFTPLTQAEYNAYLTSQPLDKANKVFGLTAETMMDTQIVASLCPGADIGVYFASWDQKGWIDLLDQVTSGHSTPVTLSVSYGLPEEASDWSDNAMASINHRLEIAAMMGITVCVSAGDDGSGCGMSGPRAHVAFPGCSPFVLSVGGTMLVPSAGKIDEVVWWQTPGYRTDNGYSGSTGGGVSALNDRPPWQTIDIPSLNPAPARKGRIVPDVAALAGPPLYDLILNGAWSPGGGTSASAPCWAALIACIDRELPAAKRQRFLPPLLYKVAMAKTGFRDVVSGNNASHPDPGKGYVAGPGFDAVSGWGVPNGTDLVTALGKV